MATEQALILITLPADADLSAKQYTFVDINSDGEVIAASAQGQDAIGILQNDPAAADEAAVVAIAGISKCFFGGTIATAVRVTTAADGQADTSASGDVTLGIAVKGAGADEVGEVLLGGPHIIP